MFMVYHKKHADISKTKNSLNGYFLKQLLEHFNERDVHTCKKTRQFKTWLRLPVQLKVTHTVHKLEYCDFIKIR